MLIAVEVAPVRPALVNCSVRAPTVPVTDNPANVARPFPSVLTGVVPPSVPPPTRATATGRIPPTLLPEASCAWTVGCCAKTAPFAADAEGCCTITSWVAAPAVMLIAVEVAPVRPVLVNCSVRAPTVPVMDRPAKVATAVPPVLTVAVPPSVPPPVRMVAVTEVVPVTGFPEASRTWTVGCCAKTAPFAAVSEGCCSTTSCDAAPAVTFTAVEVAAVSAPLVNCSVREPTSPVMDSPVKVARPFASVLTVAVPPRVPPPVTMAAVTATVRGHGVAGRVSHLHRRLLREGDRVLRRGRRLLDHRQLGGGTRRDGDAPRDSRRESGAGELQCPGADCARNGQSGERRQAVRVGAHRGGSAEGATAARNRRRHGAHAGHRVAQRVAHLDRRLLDEHDAVGGRRRGLLDHHQLRSRPRRPGRREGDRVRRDAPGAAVAVSEFGPATVAERPRRGRRDRPRRWSSPP